MEKVSMLSDCNAAEADQFVWNTLYNSTNQKFKKNK